MSFEILAFRESTDVPSCKCSACGQKLEVASSEKQELPEPGALSICAYCGHLAIFGDDLRLREPTDDEMREIKQSPEWKQIRTFQQKFRRAKATLAFDMRKKSRPH